MADMMEERWGLNGPHVDHDRIPNNTTYYRYPPCSEYWEATEDYPGITQEEALEQLVAWADAHKAYSIGGSLKLTVELTWDEDWAKKPIFTVHVQEGIQIQNCRPQDYLHDVQTWSRNLTYTVGRGQECISDGQIRRDYVRILFREMYHVWNCAMWWENLKFISLPPSVVRDLHAVQRGVYQG